jgi:homoserine kinase type II
MPAELDRLAAGALEYYPALFRGGELVALGNHGGFSGAGIWRVQAGSQCFCLRAWPSRQSDPNRLEFVHALMRRARSAQLAFVPAVIAAADGRCHVEHAGRLWDLTEWLPGRADFHDRPSEARLAAAATALAHVHNAWEALAGARSDMCPAVCRRLEAASEWLQLRQSGWQLPQSAGDPDPVRPAAERAWRLIDRCVADVPNRLRSWSDRRWTLQPCHCDVWHDHLLFDGDRLTGLIDFGSAKIDHPAVDLSRMLGSLVPDDDARWQTALRAYRTVRPFGDEEAEMVRILDLTGTIIGVATWLRWLYEERRPYDDRHAVARRLGVLVSRLESAVGMRPVVE